MQREAKNAAEGGKTGSHDILGDLAEHRPAAGRPDMRVFTGSMHFRISSVRR